MFYLSKASKDKLKGIDKHLIELAEKSIVNSPYDFKITEGLRTKTRQKQLVAEKKSQTMYSRHIIGQAFDIAIIDPTDKKKITWDFKYYKTVAAHIKKIAQEMGISITWGGDWKSFKDGPHFQIEGHECE